MIVYSLENVGQRIVEWYSCIITKDMNLAKKIKFEVDSMISMMVPDDKMLAYYQLVSLQHDLLILKEAPKEVTLQLDELLLENIANQANDYLNFMYYYVSGQTEFYKKRYKSAIRTYKIAERLIEKVKDPAEKAEFYQKLGHSYYQIDQYTFAFSYIEQALEFFEKDSSYLINVISCKQILAGIYSELNHFDKADELYHELKSLSKPHNYSYGVTNYNIAINKIILNHLQEALKYFHKALEIEEFKNSPISLKAKYHVLNLELRIGKYSNGLEELEKEVHNKKRRDLEAKLMISRGLYLDNNYDLVKEGLRMLESNEFYDECHDVSNEISKHYKENNDFKTALHYSEYSIEMGKRKIILGVDQS